MVVRGGSKSKEAEIGNMYVRLLPIRSWQCMELLWRCRMGYIWLAEQEFKKVYDCHRNKDKHLLWGKPIDAVHCHHL